MDHLVSIVVTSYNHAEYLNQRMESLLVQTYKNLEIIVIDDCSSDASLAVLETYKKYAHIRIIALEENSGYASACNLGVSLSRGEFVMFAECDDFSEPNQIEVLLGKLLNNTSVVVAYSSSMIVDENGVLLGDDFQCREKSFQQLCFADTLIKSELALKYLLLSCVIPNMSAALFRKRDFDVLGGLSSKYRACSDWDFWCRMSRLGDFYYVRVSLNNFRTHMTTVRKTTDFRLQLAEIGSLLYSSFPLIKLNWLERSKFRINFGYIIAKYIAENPIIRGKSFPCIMWDAFQYEKLICLFFVLGFCKMLYNFISRGMSVFNFKDLA